ncbi:hypothetical protein AF332_11160 [Sporosarcina globispora]|uniref:Uncharacterized protein n=1 Tax=Sporosarcina globispora TaxID=1459 RepID=A0A0M0GBV9_SPOGL|nr:glycosyl hydrolase family 28-related protein [Sporosarcina globispora]KON87329.1 hypothetical protein AF332_11160 [Sporosarcina globispora]
MALKNEYYLILDFKRATSTQVPVFVQNDSAKLVFSIYDEGKPYDLTNINTVHVLLTRPDGLVVSGLASVLDGKIVYNFGSTEMQITGDLSVTLQFHDSDGDRISTRPFKVKILIDSEKDVDTSKDMTLIQQLFVEVDQVKNDAISAGDYAREQGDNLGHKGEYNPTKAYKSGNVVTYGGINYICILNAAAGITPLNGTYWTTISPQATMNKRTWTATEGQKVFTITNGNYVVGESNIEVWVGGVPQVSGQGYVETNSTTITLSEGVPAGTVVFAKWYEGTISITKKHNSVHEIGGQDELDVTKLKNYNILKDHVTDIAINVRSFGARGDGIANDTIAFQAAHDFILSKGGGVVLIPPGTYRVQGVVFDPCVYWQGAGAGATVIKPPTNAVNGLAIFQISQVATVEFGGFKGMSIIGNGGSLNYQPDGKATVNGIDFGAIGENWVQQFFIQDCYFAYLNIAVRLNNHVRYVPVHGNRFWYNNVGMWVQNEHPNFGVNDFRYNDIGLDGTLLDVDFHGTKFNYNRIGINGTVERCGFNGCMFWQNKQLGLTLQTQNRVVGCLFRGGDSFFGTTGASLIKINGRQAIIQSNQFYGEHSGAAILMNGTSLQNGHLIDNNVVLLDKGHFIDKTGNGDIQAFKLTNNHITVKSIGDNLGGMIVRVPSTATGGWQHARYSNNDIRVETAQNHPLLDIQKVGSGHTTTDNTVLAQAVATKGFYFADSTGAIITGNRFRTSSTGSFIGKTIELAGFTTNAIIKDNHGFKTESDGIGTILNGTTFIDIAHGLDVTPAARNISVVSIDGMGAAYKFWINNVTSTSFRINVNADPNINAQFAWHIVSPFGS